MTIVSNSGPILSFSRADLLDLLCKIVGELIIPYAVYDEIFGAAGATDAGLSAQPTWIKARHVRNRTLLDELPPKLHRGEREAIALAKELGAVLLVDERNEYCCHV